MLDRIVAYLRISKSDKRSNSLRTQQDALDKYLAANPNLDLFATYVDDGVSGAKKLHLRPQGKRMLKALDNQVANIKGIWAWKLDRLFRNTADATTQRDRLLARGFAIHTGDVELSAANSTGNMVFDISAAMAAFESTRASERILENKASRRGRGLVSAVAAYGYVNLPNGTVGKDKKEQGRLKFMQKKRRDGWSLQQIAVFLNQKEIPTKSGKGTWKRATVQRIIKREEKYQEELQTAAELQRSLKSRKSK